MSNQLDKLIKTAKKNYKIGDSDYAKKFLENMKNKGGTNNLTAKQYFYLTHLADGGNPHHYQK